MKTNDKYDFIGHVLSLIYSDEYDATVISMSKDCNVPVEYMRKTICSLLNNKIIQSCIYTTDDYVPEDTDSSFIEEYLDNPKLMSQKLNNGDYDYISWNISFRLLSAKEDEILTISHLEYGALKLLKEDPLLIKRGSLFEKKESISPISSDVMKNKKTILNAIETKSWVSFIYRDRNNRSETVTCYPLELFTNVNDNWVYLRSSEGTLYRLDRISQNCKVVNNTAYIPENSLSSNHKYAWGAYYKEKELPTHVKIQIGSLTPNLKKKIKNDIAYRKNTCKFYEDGDVYYYEDDIIGMGEFQRWVRSYGSSMLYLEPAETRNTVIERAHQTLELYQLSDKWSDL